MSGRKASRDMLHFWQGDLGKDPQRRYDTFLADEQMVVCHCQCHDSQPFST